MAKLTFYYSSMNSGKTTNLIQKAYNYEECGLKVAIIKPVKDTKIPDSVSSRIGLSRKADILIDDPDFIIEKLKELLIQREEMVDCIFVEAAEFLTAQQINELVTISTCFDIEVICYGLRIDFAQNGFPGSDRLLQVARLIPLETKCKTCGELSDRNARKVNGSYVIEGEQISIDGIDSTYDALCEKCYLKHVLGIDPDEVKKDFKKTLGFLKNKAE